MTSFPHLTGLRSNVVSEAFTVETCISKLCLADLHKTAESFDASSAAILQLAWAHLLQTLTGTADDITFDCILPSDECTNAKPFDRVICTFDVQGSRPQTIQHVIQVGLVESHYDASSTAAGEQVQQRTDETLLDLEHLSALLLPSKVSDDRTLSPAICLKVCRSTEARLSLQLSGLNTLINAKAAQLLLTQYDCALGAILAHPDNELHDIYAQALPSLLSISNPKPTEISPFRGLQSQFEDAANLTPDHVALEVWNDHGSQKLQPNTRWTYAELDRKAATFAGQLQSHFGSVHGQVIPICMERCPNLYVAILGILKAGAAWCPIDPSFPSQRRHDLIARVGTKVLIVNLQSPRDGIPEGVMTVDISKVDWRSATSVKQVSIHADDLAYLIWTSGTTGSPKGVPISHGAAMASMMSLQTSIPTKTHRGSVRCLQFSQFTFDVFVQDLFYTWGVNGTLITADRVTILGAFSDLVSQAEATHAHLTPAFAASVPRDTCPTLEVVTMIGEKLTQDVADDWSTNGQLYNTYGPAEATVVATVRRVPHRDVIQSGNIGTPLPSVSAFVLQDGRITIKGAVGELALGGPQLATGYWNDQMRTGERFVWNAYLKRVLYMTGDMVRQLHDGTFEFIGRTDDLIKIQGIRIELSEIAFVLRSCHPNIQQVEVLFLDRPDRLSKVIVAFLAVPALSGTDMTGENAMEVALKGLQAGKALLPDYMVPKVFLAFNSIPKTPSAKIDRNALSKIYADVDLESWESKMNLSSSDDHGMDKLDSQDNKIINIIAELTGSARASIRRESALPSIGIDSITATRLAAKLKQEGIEVSVMGILQCVTVEDLLVSSRQQHTKITPKSFDLSEFHRSYVGFIDPTLVNHIELLMPVLSLQEAMLSESFRDSRSYWSHKLFHIDQGTDLHRLERSWKLVAQQTDALRTLFFPVGDMPKMPKIDMTFVQAVLKEPQVDWRVVSTTEYALQEEVRDRAHGIAEHCQGKHFTLPLWAVTIFRLHWRDVMMFSMHHAIRDEPSLDMIMADLRIAYITDTSSSLPQRSQLRTAISFLYSPDDGRMKSNQAFWESRHADFQSSKSWPEQKLADKGGNAGTTTYEWRTSSAYSNLRKCAVNIGSGSLASILRTVWGFLLCEYLETDQVAFGETWSGRNDTLALGDVIGPLLFVLPVPFHAHGTWRQMLQRETDSQQQRIVHRGVHPSQLKKILQRAEGESLYPAVFNFVPANTGHEDPKSPWQELQDIVELSVEHSIAFNVFVSDDDALAFELTALKNLTDQPHLHLLAQQIDTLLFHLLESPDSCPRDALRRMPRKLLSITPVDETPSENPAWAQTPNEWVDHYASVHPHWIATEVVCSLEEEKMDCERWSYEELRTSYRNAATLIRNFRCTRRTIAVCLGRSLGLYAIVLAIMSTGNIYLPIADDLPLERRTFLLQDSDAALLFTTKSLSSGLSRNCPTLHVEDIDFSKQVENYVECHEIQPTDNAYLLYTSGSTGTPKGVLVSRGNLMSFIEAISRFIGSHIDMPSLQGKGKWLGMASYAFDVHLLEMFFPWRHGMATATASRTLLLDNLELALRRLRITHASFVPSLVDNAGLDPANLPELRYMSLGGEKMSKKAIDTWSQSHVILANAYGPTEATIGCCFRRVEPSDNVRNIGHPLSYTTVHVLRPDSTEYVLRGTSGELCLTGDLVATGYHKRPDAKGFVEDFRTGKMYRTGDRVRMMADGSLEFLGRDDDQTKIRGQRIELAEVSEAVRSAFKQVLGTHTVEVVSLVLQHPALTRPQLIAFVVTGARSAETVEIIRFPERMVIEDIRTYCRNILPSFMVPDHFLRLTSQPLVPTSRKVDVKQLRLMFDSMLLDDLVSLDRPASDYTPALNDAEIAIRSVVAKVLAVEETMLKADSNLFEFGLDSLTVIGLTIKLSKKEYNSSIAGILKNPTIKAIAATPIQKKNKYSQKGISDLEEKFKASMGADDYLGQNDIESVLPCLPLQETLVATSVDNEGEALYVNHVYLELSPDIDLRKLILAWTSTAKDHKILRTCFREFENGWIQIALKDAPLSIEEILSDSISLDVQKRESDTARDIVEHIEVRPPIRLTLATSKLDAQKESLLVSIHHALYDLDSFTMILDEVYARYQAVPGALAARTPIEALIAHIDSQSQEDAKTFWAAYLADYQPSPPVDAVSNSSIRRSTSRDLGVSFSKLETLAASLNNTPASLMQILFGIALVETNAVNDLVFGAVLSGRTVSVENAHSILAPCITTIPQRVQIPTGSTLRDIIKSAQEGFVESIEYQHTALRSIHRWVKAKSPLFDTLFTYTPKQERRPWSKLWRIVDNSMQTDFALAMEVVVDRSTNRITCVCEGTFERSHALFDRIEDLLNSLAEGEDVSVGESVARASQFDLSSNINGAQWTKVEADLKDAVAEICDIKPENIATDTSFFALGIDSITAIQLVRRLRHNGLQCSSADVMRYPCISKLAQHIGRGGDAHTSTENGKIPFLSKQDKNGFETVYPCTPLQSSMLTQTLGSDSSVYVHHHAIRLGPQHDRSKLREAWEDLVARTEILRTGFSFSKDTKVWSGTVHKQPYIVWNEHAVSVSLEQVMATIKEAFVFHKEVDFARPPWRVDHVGNTLILSLHHSLYDEDSIRSLFRDFTTLFTGSRLPQRPSFSVAARMIHESGREAKTFWIRRLAGFGGGTVAAPVGRFQEVTARLDVDLNAALKGCRSFGVTLQSMALLAFGKTLAVQSKRQDLVFGHVVRGRTLSMSGVDDVIGPLFNTVPMRIQLGAKGMANRDAVRAIQDITGESQAHQHASLSRIQAAWHRTIDKADAELFDTLFVFQKRALEKDDTSWDFVDVDDSAAPTEYATSFECEQTDTGINVCINSRSLENLRSFVHIFEETINDILNRPNEPVLSAWEDSFAANGNVTTTSKPMADPSVKADGNTLAVVRKLLASASGISENKITEDASIFSLGLDSISAIQIAATAHKQGLNLSVADVLQGRTVSGICQRLDQRKKDVLKDQSNQGILSPMISPSVRSKALAIAGVRDDDVEEVLPCLPGQHYHLMTWLKSGRTLGEGTFTYYSTTVLDLERLQSAWSLLRKHHAILRTTFASTSVTEAWQLILKPAAIRSGAFHLIEPPPDQPISQIIRQIASRRFDLFSPPAELSVVQAQEKQYIVLRLHHALYDARTINILMNDLTTLYTCSPPLPLIPQTSSIMRTLLHPQTTAGCRAYWQQALSGYQPTLLPHSNPNPKNPLTPTIPEGKSNEHPFFTTSTKIPNLHALESTCREYHTSLPTIILIDFARTLAHYASTPNHPITNPVFGIYQSGHLSPNQDSSTPADSTTPTLTLLPLLLPAPLTTPTSSLLETLHATLAARVPYLQTPLHKIVRWIDHPNTTPLFNTAINILWEETSYPTSTTNYPTTLDLTPESLEDVVPSSRLSWGKTPVSGLGTGILAEEMLFVDVRRCEEENCIQITGRCDNPIMGKEDMQNFLESLGREVETAFSG